MNRIHYVLTSLIMQSKLRSGVQLIKYQYTSEHRGEHDMKNEEMKKMYYVNRIPKT